MYFILTMRCFVDLTDVAFTKTIKKDGIHFRKFQILSLLNLGNHKWALKKAGLCEARSVNESEE